MTTATTSKQGATGLRASYPYYLAGEAVAANTDLEVTNKYTGEVATRVAMADAATIDRAIAAAVDAFDELRRWPAFRRKAVLRHVVERMEERAEEMAVALAIEAGKPLKDARGEVTRGIDTFTIAMEESTRLYGEVQPLDISPRAEGYQAIWKRVPIGPCSFISPFNFPINLAAHKIAPAIAVGCSFVLKPASRTPIGALIMGEILAETDLPKGAFSILPCRRDGADLFTTDERFKLLSFTGSPDVGWDLKARAGKKKVVLELGGNAACVVDSDADLDFATDRIIHGAFYQSGQSCIGVQRIIVHRDVYPEVREMLRTKASRLKKGDPLDEQTFLGPLITEGDAKRMEEWVNEAVAGGASVLVGGRRDGVFYDATIVENAPNDSKITCQEAFGPIATLQPFDDFEEAMRIVDDSVFGLQAGIFTRDINRAFYAFEELEVGGVVVNDVPSMRVDSMPYGGVKDSGLGREGIRFAMEDMTEIRLMVLNRVGAGVDVMIGEHSEQPRVRARVRVRDRDRARVRDRVRDRVRVRVRARVRARVRVRDRDRVRVRDRVRARTGVLALLLFLPACAPRLPDLAGLYDQAAMSHDELRNPVIVIPGILGSRLAETGSDRVVWGAFSGDYANPERADGARLVALPMREGAALADLTDDVTSTGVLDRLRVDLFGVPVELDAYLNILGTLGVGGYRDETLGRSGAIDYGEGHYTCFQFDYDWRRDNAENARLLHAFILDRAAYVRAERARRLGVPDTAVKFDIVAHSMGGLIARHYLRYGDAEAPADGATPVPTWAGAEHVERAILIGTPNAGSALAVEQLVDGAKFAFFLPTYSPAVLGTMPSIYQLLPRPRHGAVRDASGAPIDILDPAEWERRGWGLADPRQDVVLRKLLPDVADAAARRTIALDHQRKCLERARRFFRGLDTPARTPPGLQISLISGDAEPTPSLLEANRTGKLRVVERAPGDGTVARTSALMDERVGGEWVRGVRTPIDWWQVMFLFSDHLSLTKDPAFVDNVLYQLLEAPRQRPGA